MLVSAIEKKAEMTSSTASATSCAVREMSIKGSGGGERDRDSIALPDAVRRARSAQAATEHDLEHEAATDVGDEQRDEARERPAQCLAPAPAVAPPPRQQQSEDHPGDDREQRLMVEAERAPEHFLGEDGASDERQRQQDEAQAEDVEQQPLEREQRRQAR